MKTSYRGRWARQWTTCIFNVFSFWGKKIKIMWWYLIFYSKKLTEILFLRLFILLKRFIRSFRALYVISLVFLEAQRRVCEFVELWTLTCCSGNILKSLGPSGRISGDVRPNRRSPLSSTAHLHPQKTTLFSGIWILCLSWTCRQREWELLRDSSAARCRWSSERLQHQHQHHERARACTNSSPAHISPSAALIITRQAEVKG